MVAALAFVMGVGLVSPVWAEEAGASDDGSGFFSAPKGGPGAGPGDPTGGGRGGESDPDWWQTDVWTGSEMGALPAPESPRVEAPRGVLRFVTSSFHRMMTWLSLVGGHRLGF